MGEIFLISYHDITIVILIYNAIFSKSIVKVSCSIPMIENINFYEYLSNQHEFVCENCKNILKCVWVYKKMQLFSMKLSVTENCMLNETAEIVFPWKIIA